MQNMMVIIDMGSIESLGLWGETYQFNHLVIR
jgi:hypothetical protein